MAKGSRGGSRGFIAGLVAAGAMLGALSLNVVGFLRNGGPESTSAGTVPATADPAPTTGSPTTVALAAGGVAVTTAPATRGTDVDNEAAAKTVAQAAVNAAETGANLASPTTAAPTTSTAVSTDLSASVNSTSYADGTLVTVKFEGQGFNSAKANQIVGELRGLVSDASNISGIGRVEYPDDTQVEPNSVTTAIKVKMDHELRFANALADLLSNKIGKKVEISSGVVADATLEQPAIVGQDKVSLEAPTR